MRPETAVATATIAAPPSAVFDVLTDPSTHASIDGTGWVCEPVDGARLDHVGQVFRMGMYHRNHPDGNYEVANKVDVFEPGSAIEWQPGGIEDGEHQPGGWSWRYDLAPVGDNATKVTLTYDWSNASDAVRDEVEFPPFEQSHLDNSLDHLGALATRAA